MILLLNVWLITDEEQQTKFMYIVYVYMYVETHQLTYDLGQLWAGHIVSFMRCTTFFSGVCFS